LDKLGKDKIDYLMVNAAISNGSDKPGPNGSKWCEALIVNHYCEFFQGYFGQIEGVEND
jgi:hypothetical protein